MYSRLSTLYNTNSVKLDNTKYTLPEGIKINSNPIAGMSKDPAVWGPHLWRYLHYSAANYPIHPDHRQNSQMAHWLANLHVTIPCEVCSQHYKRHIDQYRGDLHRICSTRDTLFNFLVDTHNAVNARNGKPLMSYEQARTMYGCQ